MKRPQSARQAARKRHAAPAGTPMRDALLHSLMREAKKGKRTTRLQAVVDKLVDLALKGDFYAVKEIFDRVDRIPVLPGAGEAGNAAAAGIRRTTGSRRSKGRQ